ncbi:NarL family two-component system response regulator YdfI [Pullulanibacillus pueri]|uniref:DNA-binding response regulator n=1 Tax=Pullulanibacillus pueri TaxID=1437324 RepID=A0A8J2ZWZ2_9BACL|nr:response regulator transcription factor [Pullulanibacillus pueri]MBM7682813.1 NarL family two-component system response regulator YdfI [Pullulanibacillus pueri]GGH83286.1 DNA-binding response regulator [Pullulanibacillus pueri]
MTYSVLIVDDHFVVREGLKLILETNDRFEVIGEAENGSKALEFIENHEPDVILMDLKMPVMDGLETIKALNDGGAEIPIIILTTYNEDELMMEALSLGAKGYLLKDTSREDLFHTIESAIRGETLLKPETMAKLLTLKDKNHHRRTLLDKNVLTDKELFIVQAVAKGYRNKEIALDMGIAERTIKAHLTNIFNKLSVNSRAEAVAVAMENELIH